MPRQSRVTMSVLVSVLLLVQAVAGDQTGDPATCIAFHCALEGAACVLDAGCLSALQCMIGCDGRPDQSQCQFECEMTLGLDNQPFINLLRCMASNGCFPEVPPDGVCLAGPEDTVQQVTDISQVGGSWWVVRGVNCGQDDVWLGGYDWYPCQHERYLPVGDGWINNTTYCGGTNSTCSTGQIVTIPHATLPSPGLIRLDYDDEPLLPQVERWHIVALDGDFMFVMWCGQNPALNYNGAFVLSRDRTEANMDAETEERFREVATRHGVDYDAMCLSDNTNCPDSP